MNSNENFFVGLVALALVPVIGWRIMLGFRDGRLPLYRRAIRREDDPAKFNVLLALHALSLVAIAVIAADLLLGLGLRD